MEHLINLNFAPGGLPATVHVSQYDDTIRQLRFQLWFGRSKVEVPSGASVRVDIKKPDGHIVLVTGTVDSSDRSIVTVPTTKQMTAAPGGARGTLVVSSTGDKRISSAIFILQVHRDPVEDGDASDSDLSMLQDAIDQTAANATAAQAAATAAQQAASSFTTDTTLSVSGKAADAAETGRQFGLIKADLGSFKETGGADKYISNVRVYGSPASIGISNIRNNYGSSGSEQTGFAIFTTTSDTVWGSAIKNVTNAAVSGHFKETLSDGRTYEFDYDLSGLASGTRDTARDAAHIIKSTCFYNVSTPEEVDEVRTGLSEVTDTIQDMQSDFVELGGASPYFSNIKVHGPVGYTIITNLRNNFVASGGSVQSGFVIYSSDETGTDSATQLKAINSSLSGHFYQKLSDGRTYEFDYDLSGIPAGTRITDKGLAYLISEKCFDSMADNNLHLGIGAFDAFGVIGDSYASGEVYVPNGSGGYSTRDYYAVSWGQIIARKIGATCINFSKGGLTTRSWLTDPMGLALLQSSDALSLYLCALGANDISKLGVNYLGTSADIHVDNPSLNADTFYGNYGKIISAILTKSPNAKIILFTVAYTYNSVEAQFNTAIRSIASIFGIKAILVSADLYYAADSVYNTARVQNHPTAALYAGMAEANIRLIDRCVYDNLDYFADYVPITQ